MIKLTVAVDEYAMETIDVNGICLKFLSLFFLGKMVFDFECASLFQRMGVKSLHGFFQEKTMLNKLFKLDQNKTSIKTEHISGLTMFMTVACMLAAKLGVSSASCMPKCGVFFALTLFGGTLLTMVLSKHQFFHAPGKGLNVFSRLLFA